MEPLQPKLESEGRPSHHGVVIDTAVSICKRGFNRGAVNEWVHPVACYISFIFITKYLRGRWKPVHVKVKEKHPQSRVISRVQESCGFGYQRSCVGKEQHTQATNGPHHTSQKLFLSPPCPLPPHQCAYPNTFLDHITVGSACINRHL